MPRRAPCRILFGNKFQLDVALGCGNSVQFQIHGHFTFGRAVHIQFALPKHAFIRTLAPAQQIRIQIRKHKFIADLKNAFFRIYGFKIHILIQFFDLVKFGCGFSVRKQQTVSAKMPVMRVLAEITAVGKVFNAVFIRGLNRLIHPVPNESALQAGVFIPKFCIFIRRAAGIAHSVRVFAKDIRSAVPLRYGIFLTFPRLCIHLALHIGKFLLVRISVTLKMHEPAGIRVFDPLIHFFGLFPAETLIAKAPANNAGVVLIPVVKGF